MILRVTHVPAPNAKRLLAGAREKGSSLQVVFCNEVTDQGSLVILATEEGAVACSVCVVQPGESTIADGAVVDMVVTVTIEGDKVLLSGEPGMLCGAIETESRELVEEYVPTDD